MAVLKIVHGKYRNIDATDKLIAYVLDREKMYSNCFGGTGVSLECPAYSMNYIKRAFGQNTGKMAEHLILAFEKSEVSNLTIQKIFEISYDICEFFAGVQVLFALHEISGSDEISNNLHIHFVINTVDVRTGRKFRLDYSNEFQLKNYIENLLANYNIGDNVKLVVG